MTFTTDDERVRMYRATAMTTEDFCAQYGVGRSKLYQEMKSGRLKAHKMGSRTLIKRADADAWLDSLPVARPRA